jgi:hypothetical protein
MVHGSFLAKKSQLETISFEYTIFYYILYFGMNRKFVELLGFRKFIDQQLHSKEMLLMIQAEILKNPQVGIVIKGTGGLRKFRLAPEGKGKSGGFRVLYVDFPEIRQTWLVTAFSKNVKVDLTQKEQKEIAMLIHAIRKELGI